MTTYNTGNPIGSTDARDLYDNAQVFDNFANGGASSYADRLGVTRRSLAGIDAAADNVLNSIGYAVPVAYASGISLTLTSQTVEYNGVVYAPKSSALPFTTSSWGADAGKFRVIQVTWTVSVKEFGAKGDGVTDDYHAIKEACAAIQNAGGGTLVFPKGAYFVNQHRIDGGPHANGITNFGFSNIDGLVIEGNGSKIVMQGGWTRTADTTSGGFTYSYQNCIGFEFNSCSNVTIRDLELDGGAATITKVAAAEGWSYGLVVLGCHHVHLENVYVHHYCTDGLAIFQSGPITAFKVSRYFSANNCKFTNNARQGCSIMHLRWGTFTNCEFSYTGQTGTYGGHSPQAGVDIEPDYRHDNPQSPLFIAGDESTGDIAFIGCGFVDNNGFEFVATNRDSVQHPVQLFGCSFKNTNNSSPQVATAARMVRFYACDFDNVAWYPGYTFNDDNTTEFHNCSLTWSRDAYGILHASHNPTLRIEGCDIKFTGTSPHGGATYLIYIQATKTYLRDNNIFYSSALHNGTTYDVVSLFQFVSESRGNRFSTDLTAAGKFFTLSYDGAVYVDDVIISSGKFSPGTGSFSIDNIVRGNQAFSTLLSSSGNKIYYGSSAPTTGTWARGDKVINTAPSGNGVSEWICTSSGTPGTWTPSYVNKTIYNPSPQIQEVITPYINGAKTNATVSFQSSYGSGSVLLEVDISGATGGGRIILARYGSGAVTVIQNTASYALTYNTSGYDGGISVNIAFTLTYPVVRAKACAGGLANDAFVQNLSVTVS